jgi:hypothetical protein
MRAVCKVHGLALLLQVGILWRCSDGLSFEVPPLAKMHFYNAPPMPRSSLSMVQKAQKLHRVN